MKSLENYLRTKAGVGEKAKSRSMSHMNEDHLNRLKHTMASEFKPEVRGNNNAAKAQCRKLVSIWFKEQNFMVDKMERLQEEVFQLMVRTKQDKRRIVFESLRRKIDDGRAEVRHLNEKRRSRSEGREKTAVDDALEEVRKANTARDVTDDTQQQQVTGDRLQQQQQEQGPSDDKQPADVSSRKVKRRVTTVLPPPPASQQDDDADASVITSIDAGSGVRNTTAVVQIDSKTDELRGPYLQPLARSSSKVHQQLQQQQDERGEATDHSMPKQSAPRKLKKKSKKSSHAVGDAQTEADAVNVLNDTNVSESGAGIISARDEGGWTDAERRLEADEIAAEGAGELEPMTQAKKNKIRARRKAKKKKEQLDIDMPHKYLKEDDGSLLKSEIAYHRRDFTVPSDRDERIRRRLLEAERNAKARQLEHQIAFFQKLDVATAESKTKLERLLKSQAAERTERVEQMAALLGMTVKEFNAALAQSNFLPQGVDPTSVEALEYCRELGQAATIVIRSPHRKVV